MKPLKIPRRLSVLVVSTTLLSCGSTSPGTDVALADGGLDAQPADVQRGDALADADSGDAMFPGPTYYCIPDSTYDAGRPFDASCSFATMPDDAGNCAEGCRIVG